jgi:hypothetical protein
LAKRFEVLASLLPHKLLKIQVWRSQQPMAGDAGVSRFELRAHELTLFSLCQPNPGFSTGPPNEIASKLLTLSFTTLV